MVMNSHPFEARSYAPTLCKHCMFAEGAHKAQSDPPAAVEATVQQHPKRYNSKVYVHRSLVSAIADRDGIGCKHNLPCDCVRVESYIGTERPLRTLWIGRDHMLSALLSMDVAPDVLQAAAVALQDVRRRHGGALAYDRLTPTEQVQVKQLAAAALAAALDATLHG